MNDRKDPFSTGTVEGENAIHFHSFQSRYWGWKERYYERQGTHLTFLGKSEDPDEYSEDPDEHRVLLFMIVPRPQEDVLSRVEAIWAAKDETLTLTHSKLSRFHKHLNGSFQDHLPEVKVLAFESWGGQEIQRPVEFLNGKNNWMRVRKLGA